MNMFWKKLLRAFQRMWNFFGGRLSVGLVLAIICIFLWQWLAEEVYEGETFRFDAAIRADIPSIASPFLTNLMTALSVIGSTVWLFVQGAFLVGLFIYFRLRHSLTVFLLTMSGTIFLTITLKNIFQRARPEPLFDVSVPNSFSFPSGHALSALCFYGITAWLLTWRIQSNLVRIVVWIFTVALVVGIGFSRIYLGVHYPSDVLAGYATAFVWLTTVYLGDFLYHKHRAARRKSVENEDDEDEDVSQNVRRTDI